MTFAKSMQCPRCYSRYTQSVEMAYSQSVRTGESGYTSISEFGRSLEPPEARSEVGYPLAVTLAVGIISANLFDRAPGRSVKVALICGIAMAAAVFRIRGSTSTRDRERPAARRMAAAWA